MTACPYKGAEVGSMGRSCLSVWGVGQGKLEPACKDGGWKLGCLVQTSIPSYCTVLLDRSFILSELQFSHLGSEGDDDIVSHGMGKEKIHLLNGVKYLVRSLQQVDILWKLLLLEGSRKGQEYLTLVLRRPQECRCLSLWAAFL